MLYNGYTLRALIERSPLDLQGGGLQMKLFRMPRWALLAAVVASFVGAPQAAAQDAYTIVGTVTDAGTQRPLANVSVTLRGTQFGTITDGAGRYTLIARVSPGEYTLAYSLIGRGEATQQITLGADRSVSAAAVTLRERAVELEGIVVTGAGVATERRRLGNVVESVSGSTINQSPGAPSIDAALQGRVPGALISQNHGQPGGGVSIRLRGTSSILGGAEPLIVVDGVIVDNNAAAMIGLSSNAAVLGSGGADRSGAALQNRLADLAPSDIERVEIIKGAAAAALYGSRANNGVIQIFTRRGQSGAPQITFRSEASANWRPGRIPLLLDGRASPGDVFIGSASAVGEPVERFDWQDDVFRTAYGTSNQLSITGGTDDTRYVISGWWNNTDGIIRGQNNERISVRARLDQRLASNLEVAVGANVISNNTGFIPEGEQSQGVFTSLIFTPTSWNPAFDQNLGRFPYNPVLNINPLDVIDNWVVESNVNRLIGNAEARWTPLPGLQTSYLFGVDNIQEENVYLRPPLSQGPTFGGEIQNPVRRIERYTNEATATHSTQLSPTLDLRTTAGFRHTFDRTDVLRAAASQLPPQGQVVGGAVQQTSQSITEFATAGGFLQAQVGFADRLTVTGGLNVEGSSAFGEDERWQMFPRVGVSYVLSEEPFWQDSGFGRAIASFRLRGSYGETGGQPPGAYLRFDNFAPLNYGGRAGLVPSTIAGNPNLRPERQREWEGGFEMGLLDDRLGVEFTYYNQRTTDLVLEVPIHPSAGYSTQFQNVGEVSNRGVELSLNTLNVQGPAFSWRSRISYAANRNRVERLFGDVERLPIFGYLNAVVEGQPVGVFFGRVFDRNPDGSIREGMVTAGGETYLSPLRLQEGGVDVQRVIGDPNPDFTLNLNNDFTIGRSLDLNVLLDGRFGNDVANFTRRIQEYFGLHPNNLREIEDPGFRGQNIRGYYTLNPTRHLLYEEWIEDGSFVKLREIALRYRLDPAWLRPIGARSLEVSVAGRNLYTWTNYSGLDPEVNLFAANTVARGVDFGTTPVPRTLVLGVNFGF
jgi:TonB-dependent starch-binding outer membrane protein SusC